MRSKLSLPERGVREGNSLHCCRSCKLPWHVHSHTGNQVEEELAESLVHKPCSQVRQLICKEAGDRVTNVLMK